MDAPMVEIPRVLCLPGSQIDPNGQTFDQLYRPDATRALEAGGRLVRGSIDGSRGSDDECPEEREA